MQTMKPLKHVSRYRFYDERCSIRIKIGDVMYQNKRKKGHVKNDDRIRKEINMQSEVISAYQESLTTREKRSSSCLFVSASTLGAQVSNNRWTRMIKPEGPSAGIIFSSNRRTSVKKIQYQNVTEEFYLPSHFCSVANPTSLSTLRIATSTSVASSTDFVSTSSSIS